MLLLATASLASCWKSSPSTDRPPPATEVSVELAAVTLGDECGDGWTPPPPVITAMATPARAPGPAPAQPAPAEVASMQPPLPPADVAPGARARGHRWACQQTSMQLSLVATGGGPATIRIKQVELLDAAGQLLGRLAPKAPTYWVADAYQPWDQQLAAGQQVAASYVLASPNWDAMEGGQWGQRGKTFQVRVTLAVGARERTIEKQAITPTMMEPPVPT